MPLTTLLVSEIDGLDARIISATLMVFTQKRRRNTLSCARELLRMDSAEIMRKIRVNHFVAQILRTSDGESLPNHFREHAAVARQEIHAFSLLERLVVNHLRP